jgi:hypothetical protein
MHLLCQISLVLCRLRHLSGEISTKRVLLSVNLRTGFVFLVLFIYFLCRLPTFWDDSSSFFWGVHNSDAYYLGKDAGEASPCTGYFLSICFFCFLNNGSPHGLVHDMSFSSLFMVFDLWCLLLFSVRLTARGGRLYFHLYRTRFFFRSGTNTTAARCTIRSDIFVLVLMIEYWRCSLFEMLRVLARMEAVQSDSCLKPNGQSFGHLRTGFVGKLLMVIVWWMVLCWHRLSVTIRVTGLFVSIDDKLLGRLSLNEKFMIKGLLPLELSVRGLV